MNEQYCCAMRRHFIIGVAGVRADEPVPVDVGDFVVDFETKPMVIFTKFCPFCGTALDNNQPFRITGVPNQS